jgi:hypothetical protein
LIVYDPAPTIRQLQLPVLALFGELDNNIMADKNRAAWEAALRAGGHRDYTLQILPKANHALLEAKVGNNAEMKSLQRIVPAYFEIVLAWLSTHINGLVAAKSQGGPRQLPIRRNRRSDVSVGNEQRRTGFRFVATSMEIPLATTHFLGWPSRSSIPNLLCRSCVVIESLLGDAVGYLRRDHLRQRPLRRCSSDGYGGVGAMAFSTGPLGDHQTMGSLRQRTPQVRVLEDRIGAISAPQIRAFEISF